MIEELQQQLRLEEVETAASDLNLQLEDVRKARKQRLKYPALVEELQGQVTTLLDAVRRIETILRQLTSQRMVTMALVSPLYQPSWIHEDGVAVPIDFETVKKLIVEMTGNRADEDLFDASCAKVENEVHKLQTYAQEAYSVMRQLLQDFLRLKEVMEKPGRKRKYSYKCPNCPTTPLVTDVVHTDDFSENIKCMRCKKLHTICAETTRSCEDVFVLNEWRDGKFHFLETRASKLAKA